MTVSAHDVSSHYAIFTMRPNSKVIELGDASIDGAPQTESDVRFMPLYIRKYTQSVINKGEWLEHNQFHFLSAAKALIEDYDAYANRKEGFENAEVVLKGMRYALGQIRELYFNYAVKKEGNEFNVTETDYAGDLYVEHPYVSSTYVRVTEGLDELPCAYLEDGYRPVPDPADPDDPRNYSKFNNQDSL